MRILIPLDGSPHAQVAMPVATDLAGLTGADIVLVAVGAPSDSSEHELATRTELQERVHQARTAMPECTVHALIELSDDPADVIIQAARTQSIDMVVMSTHGETASADALHGSVTGAVLRAAPVPITLVRPPLMSS